MPVIIVSGSPGCGKTTLCRLMAQADPVGVHLETDEFFRFIAHKVDPSIPESGTQNETVVRAYCQAAKAYSDGGYSVYLDGVVGPWMFPLIAPIFPLWDFVLLHAPLDVTLSRLSERDGQSSATAGVARRMHQQFEAVLEACRNHVIESGVLSAEALAIEVRVRSAAGQLAIRRSAKP